jgi:integrase
VSAVAQTKGDGSVVQLEKDRPRGKCRRWQLRVCVGRDPRTGKYKTRTRRFEGSYTQARAALRAFIDEVEGDRAQTRSNYTFEQYAKRNLERRRLGGELAPGSCESQATQIRAASAHIGKAKLEAVTPEMLDDMYIAMLKGDTLSGRPVGGTYVRGIHGALDVIFGQAVRDGLIVSNPCAKANPPRPDTKPKRALAPEQARALVERLDPESERECAYLLAITAGLRRGEICGLSWGDVDFEQRLLHVRHSLDDLGNLKGTKTKAGTRTLPLSDTTLRALEAHKRAQHIRLTALSTWQPELPRDGELQGDESPVIVNQRGGRASPASLAGWWEVDRKRYGLDGWCLHEFRHTYLSLLAISGVHPKVMQELAGHSSCQISMDIYTHVNMDSKRAAVDTVDAVF